MQIETGKSDAENETGRSPDSESATVKEVIAGREEIQNELLAIADPL